MRPGRIFLTQTGLSSGTAERSALQSFFQTFFVVTVNKSYTRQQVTPKNDGFRGYYPAQLNWKSALGDLYVSGVAFAKFIRTNEN